MRVLLTGAAGFIGGYIVQELLQAGHEVIGLDNFSKYGRCAQSWIEHERYRFVEGDAKDLRLLIELSAGVDQIVAGAAMIGGIGYFHRYAYDLLAENERITAAVFDAAIHAHCHGRLNRIVVISSSMVYESASTWPTPEGHQRVCPPPASTYGFQKLASEYFAQGAWEQYRLPYTIVRPFNCIGIGEEQVLGASASPKDNRGSATSHVLPDLVIKAIRGDDPMHILGDGNQLRHYTYAGDLARGIRLAIASDQAINEDFNLSADRAVTVRELAAIVWDKVHPGRPLHLISDKPFLYDVQRRSPDTTKARRMLGFEATTPLEQVIDEVIVWIRKLTETGKLAV